MVNTPVKPELTPVEAAVLQKAKTAQDTRTGQHLTGDEAAVAGRLMEKQYSWGPHHRPGHHWGPGPYVDGWYDGEDIVLTGITAAGLMVLNSWLNPRDNEPEEPEEDDAQE